MYWKYSYPFFSGIARALRPKSWTFGPFLLLALGWYFSDSAAEYFFGWSKPKNIAGIRQHMPWESLLLAWETPVGIRQSFAPPATGIHVLYTYRRLSDLPLPWKLIKLWTWNMSNFFRTYKLETRDVCGPTLPCVIVTRLKNEVKIYVAHRFSFIKNKQYFP